jgi:hypothetical protein
MQIGCHLPTQGPVATREALLTFCHKAEELQIASLWVSDHVVFPKANTSTYPGGRFPHAPETPYLEPVAVLAAAAMCTERARIGASVFILGHRHPIVMAKMLTTIDALSNGRLICGFGVGWWAEEFAALGIPFHTRGRQGDESACTRSYGPLTSQVRRRVLSLQQYRFPPSLCKNRIASDRRQQPGRAFLWSPWAMAGTPSNP